MQVVSSAAGLQQNSQLLPNISSPQAAAAIGQQVSLIVNEMKYQKKKKKNVFHDILIPCECK